MRDRKSCVAGAGLEASLEALSDASRVVGTGWAASWWPRSWWPNSTDFESTDFESADFVSMESPPVSTAAIDDGPETAAGPEPGSAPGAVPSAVAGPADASGTATESAGAPGVSALTAASGIASGTLAPGVFPPS